MQLRSDGLYFWTLSAVTMEAGSKLRLCDNMMDLLSPYNGPSLWSPNIPHLLLTIHTLLECVTLPGRCLLLSLMLKAVHLATNTIFKATFITYLFRHQGPNLSSLSASIMLYLYMTQCLEESASPRGNAYVKGLTSDPERQGSFVTRRQTALYSPSYLPVQTEGRIYHWGRTNAQSVPEELLPDARCLLSACCFHWLITSHHSPFASQLIQSSKPL